MVKAENVQVADPVLMAPELHNKEQKPDAKADLFMLGQLCYTALVGGHPFSDKSSDECLEAYQSDGMPHLDHYVENLNPDFAAWVMSLIECDPEKRPKDTGEAMVLLHAIQLDEPEPNVPGKTHAVDEQQVSQDSAPQVLTATQPVMMGAATASVHIAAANSAAYQMEMTQAQMINAANQETLRKNDEKEKKKMLIIIGSLVAVLIIGIIFVALRGGGEDEPVKEDDVAEVGEYALSIGEGVTVHTAAEQNNPVMIDLDDENTLDWLVSKKIPISTQYTTKGDRYFKSVQLVKADGEHFMVFNPVRFTTGGETILSRSSILPSKGGTVGSGYEIQIRIPIDDASSVTLDLYIVQKSCDVRVEVVNSNEGSTKFKDVAKAEHRVIKVPVVIDHPEAGQFYTIRVLATSTGPNGEMQIGLSGILVNKH